MGAALGGVVASKEIYDTFMAAQAASTCWSSPRLHLLGPPGGLRGGQRGARHPEGRHGGRVKALAPYFENAVHSLRAQACGRHPQLRPGGGICIAALPGEPAKPPYEIAMRAGTRALRALRRRHHPAGAALHQHSRPRSTAWSVPWAMPCTKPPELLFDSCWRLMNKR